MWEKEWEREREREREWVSEKLVFGSSEANIIECDVFDVFGALKKIEKTWPVNHFSSIFLNYATDCTVVSPFKTPNQTTWKTLIEI